MLLWFFSLACATYLADGQQSPQRIDTKYSPGKEYVYDYESQVVSGLPDGAKTYSGVKLRSQVRIQMASPSKIKVQLTSPRLYKINDLVDRRDPTKEMLPTELFKELMDEDSERTKGDLRKPFTVSYVRGHVDNLVTEEDDSIQSVNMKKAVLSLLELNFNDRHSMDRDVSLASPDDEPKVYRVVEPSVTGECETTYKLKFERRREDGVAGMKVEKIRDHDRCLEKHVHLEGLLDGDSSEFSETKEVIAYIPLR